MTRVFVFGSNEAGIHGAGAAAYAVKHHGAIMGQGVGLQGDSYGIPTKDFHIKTLPLEKIARHISNFMDYCLIHSAMEFDVTRIGCGLAGYKDVSIAPMFLGAPPNCYFPEEWRHWLGDTYKYHDLH